MDTYLCIHCGHPKITDKDIVDYALYSGFWCKKCKEYNPIYDLEQPVRFVRCS